MWPWPYKRVQQWFNCAFAICCYSAELQWIICWLPCISCLTSVLRAEPIHTSDMHRSICPKSKSSGMQLWFTFETVWFLLTLSPAVTLHDGLNILQIWYVTYCCHGVAMVLPWCCYWLSKYSSNCGFGGYIDTLDEGLINHTVAIVYDVAMVSFTGQLCILD